MVWPPENDEYVWDTYQKTPKISTYKLGIAVLKDHKTASSKDTNGRNLSQWVYQDACSQDGCSQDGGTVKNVMLFNQRDTKALLENFYDDYFNKINISFKIDSLQVLQWPGGGTSNLGLIMYYGASMFVETVIARNLAHNLFGSYVTPKNWTE